jgi:hypothetical protein
VVAGRSTTHKQRRTWLSVALPDRTRDDQLAVIWRSVTIAIAVTGVVVLGILLAIGQWGCCGSGISKPITGDSTWVRPPNPWIFGQAAIPGPAGKADHKKAYRGVSGANANPVDVLAALKPQGKRSRSSLPKGSIPMGDTSQPETPLPPTRGGPPPGNCSPVIGVLSGLASADCAQAGASDHNDSSGNHDSSGNGNHHSPRQGDSSDNASADAAARASDHSHGSDKGNKDHGAKGKPDKGHKRGRAVGNKHR